MKKFLLLGLLVTSNVQALPNVFTPGALNPNVTQSNINRTICVVNWTNTVRPPVNYTNKLKLKQLVEYGYADKDPSHYEEDHLIPLSLGGHPYSEQNLWPEPYHGVKVTAFNKDVVERKLHRMVCDGKISLYDAQQIISKDWENYYLNYMRTR